MTDSLKWLQAYYCSFSKVKGPKRIPDKNEVIDKDVWLFL